MRNLIAALLVAIGLVSLADAAVTGAAPAKAVKPTTVAAKPPVAPLPDAGKVNTVRFVIQAPQEAQLASQMSGKLLRFLFQEGASFRKGDRLAEFDCDERRAQLDKMKAGQGKAEKMAASQKQLLAMKAISDLDLDIALADLQEAQADVAMAQAQVNQCVIYAPYAGRVVRRVANQYEHMTVGTPVMQVVETGTLKLEMIVPSLWLRWLKTGQDFMIHVDELNTDTKARVVGLGARVDAASQTINVRAEIAGATPGLLPGMSGTASFRSN